jgi:hypothetical protein
LKLPISHYILNSQKLNLKQQILIKRQENGIETIAKKKKSTAQMGNIEKNGP